MCVYLFFDVPLPQMLSQILQLCKQSLRGLCANLYVYVYAQMFVKRMCICVCACLHVRMCVPLRIVMHKILCARLFQCLFALPHMCSPSNASNASHTSNASNASNASFQCLFALPHMCSAVASLCYLANPIRCT
jgi:hypothetical protein